MGLRIAGRPFTAGVLALYVLAVCLLLPAHALLDGARGTDGHGLGVVMDAFCNDRDCHDPGHGHDSHSHDPATCGACVHAKLTSTPAPAGHAATVRPGPRDRARDATVVSRTTVARAHPPARGPPLRS